MRRPLALAAAALLAAATLVAALPGAAGGQDGGAGPDGPQEALTELRGGSPFDRDAMWIWVIDRSHGGDPAQIIKQARSSGIGTLYIKSGDGSDPWSQFNKALVARFHNAGLDVCGWQFVYGDHPLAEARVGAATAARGADCLIIDAEGDYEGRYAAADLYVRRLRRAIGPKFPLALAGFPYVDYHPGFPYSVFFGPGAATYNLPQMYWKAIGTSVRGVYEHSYFYNRVFRRPIFPIGQTYDEVRLRDIKAFRRFGRSYRARGVSWWSWQETFGREWTAVGDPVGSGVAGYRPIVGNPSLRVGNRGDLVVWAQMYLLGAGATCGGKLETPTGIFGRITRCAVRRVQRVAGLPVDGVIGDGTWQELFKHRPFRPRWYVPSANRAGASASRVPASATAPLSASDPAIRYEIDPGPRP